MTGLRDKWDVGTYPGIVALTRECKCGLRNVSCRRCMALRYDKAGRMVGLPTADTDIFVMTTDQFRQLAKLIVTSGSSSGVSFAGLGSRVEGIRIGLPSPRSAARGVDEANEWLKDNTYLDALGWRDVVLNTGIAARQISVLGLMADVFVKETKEGRMIVMRTDTSVGGKLVEIGFIEDNPVLAHAGFKFTPKEFAEDATRAVAIGIVCLVVWDIVHECLQDHFDTVRLGVTIVSDVLKTVGAAAVGVVVAALLPVGTPIVFAFVIVAMVSTGIAMGFEALDRYCGLTDKLNAFAHVVDDTMSARLYRFFQKIDGDIKAYCYEDMVELPNYSSSD